ncbi:MAG: phosphoglucosamine mutase [Thermodesulfobacteriota bacterium]
MGRLFGTDGIRGKANQPPMDGQTAFQVGQAVTRLLKVEKRPLHLIVGRDTRISGTMLESAVAAGIASMGGDARLAGVLTTPGVAFLTLHTGAEAGMVISASHNPYEDNGIKVFDGKGFKLPDPMEARIEELILKGELSGSAVPAREMGQVSHIPDAPSRYGQFLRECFPKEMTMRGIRLILDPANGAAYKVAGDLFTRLGADVEMIHAQPDGFNINDRCGSQFPQDLQVRVRERGAAMGFAFDGDGDRLIAVDETGRVITGDQILLICAKSLKDRGLLKNNRIVSSVMSNVGLTQACEKLGIERHASRVGDRHVLSDMQRLGAVAGGEESGHIILLDSHTTSDGMITAMQLIAAVIREGKPLSQLADRMRVYPQELINVAVSEKRDISGMPALMQAIQDVEARLGARGRVLIRYSGTQNLCRVMVEGPDAEETARYARQLAGVVSSSIG